MRHSLQVLLTGVGLLIAAIISDIIGSNYQVLLLVLISAILAIGGAFVAVRGMFEVLADRNQ